MNLKQAVMVKAMAVSSSSGRTLMKWSEAAQHAVSQAPFFVRKRIRKRVEEEATRLGAREVGLEHVNACRQRMMNHMEDEIRGYRLETCFGFRGCPHTACANPELLKAIEQELVARDLKAFLKSRVQGPLRFHHEFRVSISGCPNACSQPQIVDIGLIGARRPRPGATSCNKCGACVAICKEDAIAMAEDPGVPPVIDERRCLCCGQCLSVCPTGLLEEDAIGFRVLLGGKLGRHPQLAKELPGILALQDILLIVKKSLDLYMQHNASGERFGDILQRTGVDLRTAISGSQKISPWLI
jgi:anaerobic sulfite reductase subunit C